MQEDKKLIADWVKNASEPPPELLPGGLLAEAIELFRPVPTALA